MLMIALVGAVFLVVISSSSRDKKKTVVSVCQSKSVTRMEGWAEQYLN